MNCRRDSTRSFSEQLRMTFFHDCIKYKIILYQTYRWLDIIQTPISYVMFIIIIRHRCIYSLKGSTTTIKLRPDEHTL